MTDEHLMRHWADAHSEFSSDLDRGLLRLGHFLGRRLKRRNAIGTAYAPASGAAAPSDARTSGTARAALAGAMACVATTALLATVAALASPGAANGATLQIAAQPGSPIVTHMILA